MTETPMSEVLEAFAEGSVNGVVIDLAIGPALLERILPLLECWRTGLDNAANLLNPSYPERHRFLVVGGMPNGKPVISFCTDRVALMRAVAIMNSILRRLPTGESVEWRLFVGADVEIELVAVIGADIQCPCEKCTAARALQSTTLH